MLTNLHIWQSRFTSKMGNRLCAYVPAEDTGAKG